MAAAVAAVVVTVVVVVVLAVAPHALDFAVAAALVVKKEHMTSPPLSYVNVWAEVITLSFYAGRRRGVTKIYNRANKNSNARQISAVARKRLTKTRQYIIMIQQMEKYPSGSRGSPAKGVVR